jgi:hypothetical protein
MTLNVFRQQKITDEGARHVCADPEKKKKTIKTSQKTLQETICLRRPGPLHAFGIFASMPIN